jgi:hypothetical protein
MSMEKRTDEEKKALVKAWQESGKKMTVWCRENNIPKSTFQGWLHPRGILEKQYIISRSDFIEIKSEETEAAVVIEWMNCKISIDSYNAPEILATCLPIIRRFL